MVVGLAVGWTNESDDALANKVAQQIIGDIAAQAKQLGQSLDWRYLNYAEKWQDVIASYGTDNVAQLKKVSKMYDPKGIFQKNVPGGFKLH